MVEIPILLATGILNIKHVLLFFYQDDCLYCQKSLEVNLAQKSIEDKMRKHIDAFTINM